MTNLNYHMRIKLEKYFKEQKHKETRALYRLRKKEEKISNIQDINGTETEIFDINDLQYINKGMENFNKNDLKYIEKNKFPYEEIPIKRCPKCAKVRELYQFYPKGKSKDKQYYKFECIECFEGNSRYYSERTKRIQKEKYKQLKENYINGTKENMQKL